MFRIQKSVIMAASLFFLLLISSISVADKEKGGGEIAPQIKKTDVENDLIRLNNTPLSKLKNSPQERMVYAKELYKSLSLDREIKKRGWYSRPDLQMKLFVMSQEVYLKALVEEKYAANVQDYVKLAKEQYLTNKEKYKTAKKIKIAHIYLSKSKSETKENLVKIKEELKKSENPDVEFHKLAAQYSQNAKEVLARKNKKKETKENPIAGTYDKWLIEPVDRQKMPPSLNAAFALKKVGDISEVVETPTAYHFVKLMAMTPSRFMNFDEVKGTLVKNIQKSVFRTIKNEVIDALEPPKDDFKIDDDLMKKIIESAYKQRAEKVKKK